VTAHRAATEAVVAREIAIEQAHVDRVYAELAKAASRADTVAADGLARGRTDRTGDIRDEEVTGLFERDALMYAAARRRHTIDQQYEGLVFGRLDLEHEREGGAREVRHIGRLGVRDDDYEPLVVDWRAPAAAAFYRATPVEPMGVIRRRVLRSRGAVVEGVEDDLMVPEPPDDLVVVGDGALIAALTRSRGAQMRDIVATIQRHQDEAIRAPWRGVTEITGGPGTGKTVVALHRAAYLLYSERRRFESGGILVVGPSAAYTAYIERVLPSLGEDSVSLRAVGDLVDGLTATRPDRQEASAVKGALRIRQVLGRLAAASPEGAPDRFRAFVGGHALNLGPEDLLRVRSQALRAHPHNAATAAARDLLGELAWRRVQGGDRDHFRDAWEGSREVDAFLTEWWPQLDPRAVLLRLADTDAAYRFSEGVLDDDEAAALAESYREAIATGEWSVGDVPLVDELSWRLGLVQDEPDEERGFYEIDELDAFDGQPRSQRSDNAERSWTGRLEGRERLLAGRIGKAAGYAHVLVDEAQDLSPMQWRTVGVRGRGASWTVVGDAAQASWDDAVEAGTARAQAYGSQEHRAFHMDTNYRNAREIFDYARDVILPVVPDADIPNAVRETGVEPVTAPLGDDVAGAVRDAVTDLLGQVDGSVAVIAPARHRARVQQVSALEDRVVVIDPLSTKGLEYDATVVVDPDQITAESPGGARVLYVALTRAAHRMTVLTGPRPD
jgi:DNA helicase IV